MSDEELRDRVEDLFPGEEAAPSLEHLFSDAEAPAARPGAEAAQPSSAEIGEAKRPIRKRGWVSRITLLRQRLFGRERLTLSLETTELRLLIAQGQRILRWDRAPLPAGVMRKGQVVRPDALGETAERLIARAGGPRRSSVGSLGGQRSLVRILDLPPVPPRLLEETVRRAARRELPLPLEELYLSWQELDDDSPRLRIFTASVPRQALDNYVLGLRQADVRLQAVDLKPLALVRAVNLPDVLLVDLEAEVGSVVLVRGFAPLVVRSVALPGDTARPLGERAENLVAELQRTLDFYNSTMATEHAPWSPIVCLTGALGGEEEIRERIGAHWPLVEPAPPLPLPEELPLLPYLANVGLILKRAP